MPDRQEIIETLCKIEGFFSGCRDNAHEGSKFKALFQGYMDAAKGAAELLKAQEPVEPKEIVNENLRVGEPYRIIGWECGNCGLDIDSLYKYCPHCGRAVKWE